MQDKRNLQELSKIMQDKRHLQDSCKVLQDKRRSSTKVRNTF